MTGYSGGSNSWQVATNRTFSAPSQSAKDGTGGGPLLVHTEGKSEKLAFYGNAAENLSSFSAPSGYTGQQWEIKPTSGGEIITGISVNGVFLQADGSLLTGQAELIIGDPEQAVTVEWGGETFTVGGVVASSPSTGIVSLSGLPPAGVFSGENGNVTISNMSMRFNPAPAGVVYDHNFDSYRDDLGTITYGSAYGQILDYEGDPVPGVGVKAPGFGTNSGDDGKFELIGPVDNSVDIETLYGTLQDDITFQANANPNDPQTYEFPALTLEVLNAEYDPVGSAQIEIDGATYYTDGDGTFTLSPLGLSDYDVTVMDLFDATLTLDEQGKEFIFTLGPNSKAVDWTPDPSDVLGGIKITAIDEQSGRKIRRVSATVDELGLVDTSDEDGVVQLLSTEVDIQDVTVLLATGDKRYNPSEVEIAELPDGQMATATVQLRRKDQVVNT